MIILKATGTSQLFRTRCRPHTETGVYIGAFNRGIEGVTLFAFSLTYSDGEVSGNVTIPYTTEEMVDFRLFAATETEEYNSILSEIDGQLYTSSDWPTEFNALVDDGTIVKEIFRGRIFVTNETNFENFDLYG